MIIYTPDKQIVGDDCSYGIKISENGKIIDILPDITNSKDDIEKLTFMCNKFGIEPCHIYDIIEDYMTDFLVDF